MMISERLQLPTHDIASYLFSDYCVECACARSQCPVRKAARKLKRTHSQSGGTGDHGLEGKRNSATITDSSKPSDATPVKRGTHEQLKVQIPDNSLESRQAVVRTFLNLKTQKFYG